MGLAVMFLEKPDTIFKKNLEKNPIFPFEVIGDNIYALTVQSSKSFIDLTICVATLIITISTYGSCRCLNELIIFPIMIFFFFLQRGIYYWDDRTYVLDSHNKMYEFYRGQYLVYRGHYHNIYIRVVGQNSGNGDFYYNVVLEGYNADREFITSAMTSNKRLIKLAKRLAYRLDLNYFEPSDRSNRHVVRHRCPYANVILKKVRPGRISRGGRTASNVNEV